MVLLFHYLVVYVMVFQLIPCTANVHSNDNISVGHLFLISKLRCLALDVYL